MSTITPPPSDLDVQQSVDRVAAELFDRLRERQRHPLRRRRVLLGIGGLTLAGLLVGGGGAIAGVWHLPGTPTDAVLSDWRTADGSGSRSVALAATPEGSTWLSLRLTCLSAGDFRVDLGGAESVGMTCSASEAPRTTSGEPTFALQPSDGELTVVADDGATWRLEYRYVDRDYLPWKLNANGETYGVANETGRPDLEAVQDGEGHVAYVRMETLAEGDGTTPAYSSDGVTVIGEWVVGGDDAGLHLFD